MRIFKITIGVLIVALASVNAKAQQVIYHKAENLYLELNMYPHNVIHDSLAIEEHIAQTQDDEVLGEMFLRLRVIYPEISGMSNTELQSKLNHRFRGSLKFIQPYERSSSVLISTYRDAGLAPYAPIDSNKLKVLREFDGFELTDMRGTLTQEIKIDLINNYINIQHYEGQDGNLGAHPNFSYWHEVISQRSGERVTLGSLLSGEYLEAIADLIDTLDFMDGEEQIYTDNCMGGSIREGWAKSLNHSTPVSRIEEDYIVLMRDARDFGCPEIMRGLLTMKIPLSALRNHLIH